jgi:cytohesin
VLVSTTFEEGTAVDLHWLAESGQVAALRAALAAGAHADPRDEEGRTPLHVAIRRRRRDVAATLLDAGADPEASETALPGSRPLHLACRRPWPAAEPDPGLVEWLLARGARPSSRDALGAVPLHHALPWCDAHLLHAFLDRGAEATSADSHGTTLLHVACGRGAAAFEDALVGELPDRARAVPRPDTALGRLEDEAIVETLLEAGAAVDAADEDGRTPLHRAVVAAGAAALAALLRAGASVAAEDAWCSTPLHLAPSAAIAAALLAAGAPPDALDSERRTPLHQAVIAARDDVVDLLLARGAAVNIPDREGRTALHLAAAAGRALTVEKLLERGANPNGRDADGRSPLAVADAAGHAHVVATLRRRGARR